MHLGPEALTLITQHPRGESLAPLYHRLAALLETRTISERVHCIGRYVDLIHATPTWAELPDADRVADIHTIYTILADPEQPFLTSLISISQIDDRYHIWKTVRKIPRFENNAVTGLTAIMLILTDRDKTSAARRLARALRGRYRGRSLTREQDRLKRRGELHVERVGDVLSSLPLAVSPAEQYEILLDELHRIQNAKPTFYEIISHDLRQLFAADNETEPSAVNVASFPFRIFSYKADGPDEDLGEEIYTHYSDLIDRTDASLAVQRAYQQQVIWSSNPLSLEGHVTALTQMEAKSFSKWLCAESINAITTREVDRLTSLLLLLLVMTTGRTLKGADALLRSVISQQSTLAGLIDLEQGQMIISAPMPEGSYKPAAHEQDYLLPASDHFSVFLPPQLLHFLRAWATFGSAIQETGRQEQVYDLLTTFRQIKKQDISLGRIRQYLSTRMMALGKDPAIVRWVTGDSLGHATGYLHYAHVQCSELADIYTRAVWPLFDECDRPSEAPSGAVGSKAVPKIKYVAQCVAKLSNRFNDSQFSSEIPEAVASRQNLMVTYITSMLTALAGHRISSALLELRRGDFLLSLDNNDWLGVATFSDKRQDQAHYYRPVPLGRHAAEQIGLYLLHLEALENRLGQLSAPDASLQAVRAARHGSGPLFFWLRPDLNFWKTDFEQWHAEFQSTFPHLPSNFGRHYLAHKLRSSIKDSSIQEPLPETIGGGELACLVLGHFSVIGDPYGDDSPTDIISMAVHLSNKMESVYTSQAWGRRGGLAQIPRRFRPHHIGPPQLRLKSWDPERKVLENGLKARQTRINRMRRERYDEEKHIAREEFLTSLQKIHPKLGNALTDKSTSAAGISEPLHLTRQQLSEILSSPSGSSHKGERQRGKATWTKLRVARALLRAAQRKGLYQGPLPAKPHNLFHGDQTPLMAGMYRAQETMLHLRQVYPGILANDLRKMSELTEDQIYAHLALASILYGSVGEPAILEGLLRNFSDYRRPLSYPNTVLVELDTHPPTTWALWGLPALLVVRFAKARSARSEPNSERIALAICELLPSALRPKQASETLNYLLDTARVVSRIELSGVGRISLGTDPNKCSWSLPIDRQIPLLESTGDPRLAAPYTPPKRRARAVINRQSSDWYKWLCTVIPPDSTSAADSTEQRRKVETNRRHRLPAVEKIRTAMEAEHLSEIEQALGYWVIQLLYSRKGSGPELFAHTTVYNYLTSIAPGLIEGLQDRSLKEIEDDGWSDIYSSILSGYKEGTLNRKLLQIQRLHKLIERKFDARPLPDECLPVKDHVESRVRNSLALPEEIKLTINEYERSAIQRNGQPCGEREVLQAYITLLLLAATGCRIGEITGLQHRDIAFDENKALIRIRINAFRRLKTRSAARIILISLADHEIKVINRFLEAERVRLGDTHFRPTRLLFLDLSHESRGLPLGTDSLRPYITESLRQASPVHLISYDIRHMRGTSLQAEMALSAAATPSLTSTTQPFELPDPQPDLLRLPRWTFSRAMVMGHAQPRTTNHSYGGIPWVYLAPNSERQIRYITQETVGALLEISTSAAARSMSRHAGEQIRWLLDRLSPRSPRKKGETPTSRSVNIDQLRRETIPDAFIYLLYAHEASQEGAYPSYGLSDEEFRRIRESSKSIMDETRFVLLRSLDPRKDLGRLGAAPRWYAGSEALLTIAKELAIPSSPIWEIASSYRQTMNPNQSQSYILLPLDKGEQLISLLKAYVPDLQTHTQRYGKKIQVSVTMRSHPLSRHLGWILAAVETLSPLLRCSTSSSETSAPDGIP